MLKKSYDHLLPAILATLPFPVFAHAPVAGGFSADQKLKLDSGEGLLLLRISEGAQAERRKAEFDMMAQVRKLGVLCNEPLHFGELPELGVCFSVLTFLEGTSAEAGLREVSSEVAFRIGVAAGRDLKKMHELLPELPRTPWAEHFRAKYGRYRTAYEQTGYSFPEQSYLSDLIAGQWPVLEGAANHFQHDDFHVGNIIMNQGAYTGLIDFNRMDWGDPWHDLIKMGWFSRRVSTSFCRGQLEGYFSGDIPADFWDRYCLYLAISIFPTITWHIQFYPELLPDAEKLVRMVLEDHEGFRRRAPQWSRQSSRA